MQIIINIIYSASLYSIVAIPIFIIYYLSKVINISLGASLTLCGYFFYTFSNNFNLNYISSAIFAIILSIIIGILLESSIYHPIRRKTNNSFTSLIASLGMYIILQNIVSIIWGDNTKSIRFSEIETGYNIMGGFLTKTQFFTIICSTLVIITIYMLFYKTTLGRNIRAIASNKTLAKVFGLNSSKVFYMSIIICYVIISFSGILVGIENDLTPSLGFNILIYALVSMIIGGIGSFLGLVGGAFILATSQHLGAYYIDSNWMDAIAYFILIIFLIWKPLGFSGQKHKKTEI